MTARSGLLHDAHERPSILTREKLSRFEGLI